MLGRYEGNFFMLDYDMNLQQKRHIYNSIRLKLLFARVDNDHQQSNESEHTQSNHSGHAFCLGFQD
jgi:hypothetical protein